MTSVRLLERGARLLNVREWVLVSQPEGCDAGGIPIALTVLLMPLTLFFLMILQDR